MTEIKRVGWKIICVKIVCIHISTEIMSFKFFRIRPFWWYTYLIIISDSYFGMEILFGKQTVSSILNIFFHENKHHDLKRSVVYLELDNMGKTLCRKNIFLCVNWIWIVDWLKWYILPWSLFFDQFKNVSRDLNSVKYNFFYVWKMRIPSKNRCEKKFP